MSTAAPLAPPRDNLFGVCNAIGQAFGFNPLYLRVAFMLGMLVNFQVAGLAYVLAGIAVLGAVAVDKAGGLLTGSRAVAA